MPDEQTQRDIGRIEGRLDGMAAALEDIKTLLREESAASSQSRKAMYDRLGSVESDIRVAAGIDTQVRERLDNFDERLTNEVMPTIDEVKRWKVAGVTLLALIGMGGAAIGAGALWAWDVIVTKLQGGG